MDDAAQEFQSQVEPDGISIDSIETELCICTWVEIQDENGAETMDKPIGNYVTIETNILESGLYGDLDEIAKTVSEYLVKIMDISDEDSVLVVGVGNRTVIADSLGVRVADKICVTRHMADEVNAMHETNLRSVSAISPGVMGITGLNTAEIVKSICDEVKPSLVIVIDALAASKTHRLCSTIQISDVGITPAAGLLGKVNRRTINAEYLGMPVISIGVPTVINAANIVADILNLMVKKHAEYVSSSDDDDEIVDIAMLEDISHYTNEIFPSSAFVTPKEIDSAIQYSAYVLSTAINMALFGEEWVQMSHNNFRKQGETYGN
jgi:spore protease